MSYLVRVLYSSQRCHHPSLSVTCYHAPHPDEMHACSLSLAKPPTARLECCHYFCRQCISTSLKRQPHCPICKEPANRRNIAQ